MHAMPREASPSAAGGTVTFDIPEERIEAAVEAGSQALLRLPEQDALFATLGARMSVALRAAVPLLTGPVLAENERLLLEIKGLRDKLGMTEEIGNDAMRQWAEEVATLRQRLAEATDQRDEYHRERDDCARALQNVRLFAMKARGKSWKPEYTDALLRFCTEAGHGPNPVRAAPRSGT